MKVYVVMANDFPEEVFATLALANEHVLFRSKMNRQDIESGIGRRIYLHIYEFTVIEE